MKERLEQRLKGLQEELEKGQEMHAQLAGRQEELRQTLLRIGGAIQVLQEVLAEEPADAEPSVRRMAAV